MKTYFAIIKKTKDQKFTERVISFKAIDRLDAAKKVKSFGFKIDGTVRDSIWTK